MIGEAMAAASGAGLVLNYIDTGIKVAEFLISERLPLTINNIKLYFKEKKVKKPENFNPEEALDFVGVLMKIDHRILDVLNENLDEAIKNYIQCLKIKKERQERNACDAIAERSICDTLNRIMDRNNGQLPSKYLQYQWDSFKCIRI